MIFREHHYYFSTVDHIKNFLFVLRVTQVTASEDEGEDNDKDEVSIVSNKMAIESIQNLHNYLQQNNDITVNSSFVSGLRHLKQEIEKKRTNYSTQTSMDVYLE